MPRARSAILSSLRGSLRGGPTFRATSQTPDIVMQTRPVPTDRRTAKQAAVRNAYSRLAYLWSNLSQLDKEPYQIMAEARNLTPWNCWLSFHLPLMRLTPKFYTVFAEGAGTSITNFAIGGQSGTLNGPIWQEKNQFPNIHTDGVDDFLSFPAGHGVSSSPNLTIFYIVDNIEQISSSHMICIDKAGGSSQFGFFLLVYSSGKQGFEYGYTGGWKSTSSLGALNFNKLNIGGLIKSGINHTHYVNGVTSSHAMEPETLTPSTLPFVIGRSPSGGTKSKLNLLMLSVIPRAVPLATLAALDAHYRPFFT